LTGREIREICEIQDVVRWAKNRTREWIEHVDRMPDDRLAMIVKEKKSNTSPPFGRPPKDGMKACLQHPNCSWLIIDENTNVRRREDTHVIFFCGLV